MTKVLNLIAPVKCSFCNEKTARKMIEGKTKSTFTRVNICPDCLIVMVAE